MYLGGRHFWDRRNLEGAQTAIERFQQAIARDPGYALAYVGLADAYTTLGIGNVGDFDAREYFPMAREAALRALMLDSTLAEAHAALGSIRLLNDLDWEGAERDLSRAIDLNPSYAMAYNYRAILLQWSGRFEAALREARRGLSYDPLSLFANIEVGRAFFFAKQYDSAAAQLRQTLELDSTSLRARLQLGQVYEQQRRYDDAIRELERAAGLASRSSRPLSLLAHVFARAGRRPEALQLLARRTRHPRRRDGGPTRSRNGRAEARDRAVARRSVHAALPHGPDLRRDPIRCALCCAAAEAAACASPARQGTS